MLSSATVSSRTSSSRSERRCGKNSSLPSLNSFCPPPPPPPLQLPCPASPTSFDATNFVFREHRSGGSSNKHGAFLKRFNSYESQVDLVASAGPSPVQTGSAERRRTDEGRGRHQQQGLEARDFLETFSLPRVARIADGEPLLLYRCFDSFTKVLARGVHVKKGKEAVDDTVLYFPEGYSGWFSLLNDKYERTATRYTTFLELVREQVCSFISMQPFTAYSMQPTNSTDNQGRMQYLKTQVRGGQMFQLRAVFQHKEYARENRRYSTRSSRASRSARDKDLANRYAHLISQSNQEYYVPLTTKGEFYELHSSIKARLCFPGMVHKTGPLALDKECLYKLTHLLRRVALPIKVKLLAGPLPPGLPKDFTDTFILERKYQEPLLVTCTLPPPTAALRHEISCVSLNTDLKISKCTLGFDSENRLFKSQRIQTALAFCQKNVESWYREVKIAPNLHRCSPPRSSALPDEPSDAEHHDYSTPVSVEDPTEDGKQIITKKAMEKFPKSTKWYKQFSIFGRGDRSSPDSYELHQPENSEKCKSIDRYKDMSRFIEQKLSRNYNPVKKSASFMFTSKLSSLEEAPATESGRALLKCHSLDMELNSRMVQSREDFRIAEVKTPQKQHPEKDRKKTKQHADLRRMSAEPDVVAVQIHDATTEKSFITERLCSRFHVKTKMSGRIKPAVLSSVRSPSRSSAEEETQRNVGVVAGVKSVGVQVHRQEEEEEEDIPYSQVADEVRGPSLGKSDRMEENIYAEICEKEGSVCDKRARGCARTTVGCKARGAGDAEYHYVKLGSNGDSVTQSDSDEAIYSTLR